MQASRQSHVPALAQSKRRICAFFFFSFFSLRLSSGSRSLLRGLPTRIFDVGSTHPPSRKPRPQPGPLCDRVGTSTHCHGGRQNGSQKVTAWVAAFSEASLIGRLFFLFLCPFPLLAPVVSRLPFSAPFVEGSRESVTITETIR